MRDTDLRTLKRELDQDPDNVELRKRWLTATARSSNVSNVVAYFKVKQGEKWFSNSYPPSFVTSAGTRFKTEAAAMKALLTYVQRRSRRIALETSVAIVWFEVHTLETHSNTIDLVTEAHKLELSTIRDRQESLAKQVALLKKEEEAILSKAGASLKEQVTASVEKTLPKKKRATKKKATLLTDSLDLEW